MPESIKTVKVAVRGRVQGVWFRAWTCEQAESRGLNGWVRNRRDGSVEAVLSGPDSMVDEMIVQLWQGPPAAKVTGVQSEDLDDSPEPGFHQRATAW